MWERESIDRRELGEWSFELRGDEVADLCFRGRRVLRSIRAVVRDRDWNTATWAIDGVDSLENELRVRVHTVFPGVDATGVVRVAASGDVITVTFDAVAGSGFETNRTGLVVLHPPHTAGAALAVTHADGSAEETAFPAGISPHQPVRDIAALSWNDEGVAIDVRFDGDVFEMEDQRNWTDASFKTYSRPLSLPFPYPLASGERVRQTITVRARQATPAPASSTVDELVLRTAGAFPQVSVGASTAPDPAPADVPPFGADLLVELDLAAPSWRAALARAAASGVPLDVRLVLADEHTDQTLSDAVAALRAVSLARITAFWPTGDARHVSDQAAIALLRHALASAGVQASVVGGVRSHFTELNRENHRLPAGLEGIVFSVTPLFHSLDTEQAVESIGIQRLVAEQAVRIADATPVHIGPITLRPHFNDVATTAPPLSPHDDLTAGYGPELLGLDDPRQQAPELAAWTIASAAALAVDGVASLSYFEEWGARGIRSSTGEELPVAAAIRAFAGLAGTTLMTADSPDGLLWAIGSIADDGTETVLVANLDRIGRTLRVLTPHAHAELHLGPHTWASVATL